jgi:hypothetical protein
MSGYPPKADIGGVSSDVRFVPKAELTTTWAMSALPSKADID